MGLGVAEVDKHAVAQILRHETAETAHSFSDAFVIAEMSSRRSSGSIRAASAVEPTRSENITVTCRRSAASAVRGAGGATAAAADVAFSAALRLAIARNSFRR